MNAKVRTAHVVLLANLAVGSVAAQSTEDLQKAILDLSPGMSTKIGNTTFTMRQKLAGTPDAGGWYTARSIGAGFVVQLPVPFSELTSKSPTTDGSAVESHTLGGGSRDGARFMVNCLRREDGKVTAGWVESVADSLVEGRTLVSRSRVSRRGLQGVELALSTLTRRSHAELLEVNGYSCQLTVEYPFMLAPKLSKQARAFFDSFSFP